MDWLLNRWRGRKYWKLRLACFPIVLAIALVGVLTMHGEAAFWIAMVILTATNLPFYLDDRRVSGRRKTNRA